MDKKFLDIKEKWEYGQITYKNLNEDKNNKELELKKAQHRRIMEMKEAYKKRIENKIASTMLKKL